MKTKEVLILAHRSLFETRKKVSGDLTISRNGKINRYECGDGSTFAKIYDEKIIFEVGYMANEPISVFEAWDLIKDLITSDDTTRDFLNITD